MTSAVFYHLDLLIVSLFLAAWFNLFLFPLDFLFFGSYFEQFNQVQV